MNLTVNIPDEEIPATMRREGLTEVLTSDRHFEQEGFRALLRDF
jgi:predicted nucleic acid-binding protein